MLLSLGEQGGLFQLFVNYVPGYQLFRTPARHGMVAGLGVTVLAGFGLDSIIGSNKLSVEKSQDKPSYFWIAGLVISAAALLLAASYQEPNATSYEILAYRLVRGVVWFLSAGALFYLAYRRYRATPTTPLAFLLIGVIALDLFLYAYPQIYQGSKPAELAYIASENFTKSDQYSVAFLERGDPGEWGNVNVAAENGVRLLNMYTGIIPQRMTQVINILAGRDASYRQEENLILLDDISRPDLLDFLGVRYLLVNSDVEIDHDRSLQEHVVFDSVRSLENNDAMPFAFVVPDFKAVSSSEEALAHVDRAEDLRNVGVVIEGDLDQHGTNCPENDVGKDGVSNLRLEGGNIWFDIDNSKAGMVIVNQTFLNGWKGWVDGEQSKVYPVNYRWIGIYLACPGEYQIHLRYVPKGLAAGLFFSTTTLLVVLAVSFRFSQRHQIDKQ
jgi:hypothetical protein